MLPWRDHRPYCRLQSDDPVVVATVLSGATPTEWEWTLPVVAAYVANYGSNSVSVIDTTTNTVTDHHPCRWGPFGVGVDPVTHHAYVANFNADTVSVIDTTTDTVTTTIGVGSTRPGWGSTRPPTPPTSPTAPATRCR